MKYLSLERFLIVLCVILERQRLLREFSNRFRNISMILYRVHRFLLQALEKIAKKKGLDAPGIERWASAPVGDTSFVEVSPSGAASSPIRPHALRIDIRFWRISNQVGAVDVICPPFSRHVIASSCATFLNRENGHRHSGFLQRRVVANGCADSV